MPTAILVGFEYSFNPLPGAIIDLYHCYKWLQSFNCETYVLTDIESIHDPDNLRHCIDKNIADSDLITFYDSISSKFIVRDGYELMTSIIRLIKTGVRNNKLVIYFTGHGVRTCLVMPNKSLLSFVDFRDNLLDNLEPYTEIFWILDCCNPSGLHLPYRLDGNLFVLSQGKIECVSQPILLITSSEPDEKSIATKSGSLFSRYLFRLLTSLNNQSLNDLVLRKSSTIPTSCNRNLRRLMGNLASAIRKMHTGYSQTVSIYSSYVMDPILWMWIGSKKSYDIAVDMGLSTLIIRKHPSIPSSHQIDTKFLSSHNPKESIERITESIVESITESIVESITESIVESITESIVESNQEQTLTNQDVYQRAFPSNYLVLKDTGLSPMNKLLTQVMSNPYDLRYPE
jgi:hypothetical protein